MWLLGGLGVGLYGLWGWWHGGFLLPNSLLMKSAGLDGLPAQVQKNLADGAPVWAMVSAACLAGLRLKRASADT